jgi:threonine synthase
VSFLTHLECTRCASRHDADVPQRLCTACQRPLAARYDLAAVREALGPDPLASWAARSATGLWRFREVLPVARAESVVTLGEGATPLLEAPRLAHRLGLGPADLLVKDEGQNPTGSFKARGMAVAVSRALELGAAGLTVPSAGNAASAHAAYAGVPAHVFVPDDCPEVNVRLAEMHGARVVRVRGLIGDAGVAARREAEEKGFWDLSTLQEPYRVEGKKTLGYEVCLALGRVPDAIVYPTGGGTGLVGMWKAWAELEALGCIGSERPRMISVQVEGCAPIVRAFRAGAEEATPFANASTRAAGLRVPSAVGDRWMLEAIRASGGTAIAVSDEEAFDAARELPRLEGISASVEAGAAIAALRPLVAQGAIRAGETTVVFVTANASVGPEVR